MCVHTQNESLDDTIERFKSYMGRFEQAPWTLQRLCEVLLAPRNQYAKLHKVCVCVCFCVAQSRKTDIKTCGYSHLSTSADDRLMWVADDTCLFKCVCVCACVCIQLALALEKCLLVTSEVRDALQVTHTHTHTHTHDKATHHLSSLPSHTHTHTHTTPLWLIQMGT